MNKLTYEKLIEENPDVNIMERHFNSDNIKGLYFNGIIAINDNIETTTERMCILAEELGHYHLTVGNILDQTNSNNRKQEHIARMWGYNKLIGLQRFIDAFEHHCTNLYETAEYLDVTVQFLLDSIDAYKKKYGNYIHYGKYTLVFREFSVDIMKRL